MSSLRYPISVPIAVLLLASVACSKASTDDPDQPVDGAADADPLVLDVDAMLADGATSDGGTSDDGATPSSAPRGLFVVDDGTPSFAAALASNNVDGALIRSGWAQSEASDDNFDFTALCNKLAQATNAGKAASIVTFAYTPTWLEGQVPASELWTDPQFGQNVVPWSSTGQAEYREFVTAMANHVCPGQSAPLKALSAIQHVDAGIIGIQGIRRAPSTSLATMTAAIIESIDIVRDAWGPGHVYYTTLFPITGCCGGQSVADTVAIRDAILAAYPDHAFFAENWTGSGPGPNGSHADVLEFGAADRRFPVMLQACGYWSSQTRIPCSFDNSPDPDSPLKGWNQVGSGYDLRYVEIYPSDIVHPDYADDIAAIHAAIWP